jgi:hypothetical protein
LCQGLIVFDKAFKATSLLQETVVSAKHGCELTGVSAKVAAADTEERSDDDDDDNASAPLLSPNDFPPKKTENHGIPKTHGNVPGVTVHDLTSPTPKKLFSHKIPEKEPFKVVSAKHGCELTGVSAKVAAADTEERSDDDDDNASAPLLSPNNFPPKKTENHGIPKTHGNVPGVTVHELSSPTPVKVKEEEQEDSKADGDEAKDEGSVTDDGSSDEEILIDRHYSQQQTLIDVWADNDFGSPESIKALSKRHRDEHKKKVKPSLLNPNSVKEGTRRSTRGRKNKN